MGLRRRGKRYILQTIAPAIPSAPNRAFAARKLRKTALAFILSVGTIVTTAPAVSAAETVVLDPSDNVVSIINGKPSGTTFVFEPGVYRGFQVVPKSGTTFIGQPGAILSGSRILSHWSASGGLWRHGGQTQSGSQKGECASGNACRYPEDIYVNDTLLRQVTSKSAVAADTFFFDYSADTVWIGQSPASKLVEIGYVSNAFSGGGSNITIDGLVIEKYANPAQSGAIQMKYGDTLSSGWTVRNTEVRWNHGTGIKMGTNSTIVGNFIHSNGQLGIGSGAGTSQPRGTNNLVENNEISYNTTIPFSSGFEVGGTKFARDKDLLVRGNYVHNNTGPGLWCDVECIDAVFEDNIIANNKRSGIFFEISYGVVIRDNLIVGNGADGQWLYGAGIVIAHSRNAEVYGNTVAGNDAGIVGIQQNRGSGSLGPYEVRNLKVYDNTIVSTGGKTGIGSPDSSSMSIFNSWGNQFFDNTYYFDKFGSAYYDWNGAASTQSQWQAAGNDTDGEWRNISSFVMPDLPPEGQGWTGPGGGGGGGGGGATFSDISGNLFEADIEWLAAQGITSGCNPPANTKFCPNDRVTRGQMAAFLDRALTLAPTGNDYFSDDNNSPFEDAINRLAHAGITSGCDKSGTRFCVNDSVTRGQLAAFLVRALGFNDDGGGDLFTDDDTSVFEADIDRLATAGVTKGCNPPSNSRFCPDQNVTRGQMAAFLRRAID